MGQSDGGREEGKMEGEREDGGGNGKMKGRQREERIAFFSYHTKKATTFSLAFSISPTCHSLPNATPSRQTLLPD